MAPESGRASVTRPVAACVARVVLTARGWAGDADAGVTLDGAAITLRRVGDLAVAIGERHAASAGELRVSAASAPERLLVRHDRQARTGRPCDALLPATLLPRPGEGLPPPADPAWLSGQLAAGLSDEALGEMASLCLGGAPDARHEAARAVVHHLAAHPLDRPDVLGVLVAALGSR